MRNYIRRIDSREVYRGNLVRLREDSVVLPRGTQMMYEYVEIKHGASTLAVEDNGDVWLVREWKYAIDRPSLEVVSEALSRARSLWRARSASFARRRGSRRTNGLLSDSWTRLQRCCAARITCSSRRA